MLPDPVKAVEQNILHEQKYSDGIPQIAAGLFLMFVFAMLAGDRGSYVGIFIVFVPLVIKTLRKKFTYPRIGYAQLKEISPQRQSFLWLIAAFLIAGLVVFLALENNLLPPIFKTKSNHILTFFITVTLLMFLAIRYHRDRNSTLMFYAVFILFLALGISLFRPSIGTTHQILFLFGFANFLYGIVRLLLFIKKYPVLNDEP